MNDRVPGVVGDVGNPLFRPCGCSGSLLQNVARRPDARRTACSDRDLSGRWAIVRAPENEADDCRSVFQ